MKIHDIAEITSLVMTVPTVFLAVAVVWMWLPAALQSLSKGFATGHDWFIVGVVLGFLGSVADNLYWAIPWSASYLEAEWADAWFESGVYVNIPFRQGTGIMAAYCHLKAGQMTLSRKDEFLNRLLIASYATALVVLVGLWVSRAQG